jgi:hypothetical protein
MPAAPAFASVTDLRALMGRTRDTLPDDRARVVLNMVSGAMRLHCNWPLSRTVVVAEVLHGRGRYLWLPTLWLTSVDAVTEGMTALVPGQDYTWERHGKLSRTTAFGWGSPVVVSYTHGYTDLDPQWSGLSSLCLSVAARMPGNPSSLRSWTVGNESLTAAGAGGDLTSILSDAERRQLGPYVLEPLG